ncbi:peptide transporter (plasmid) [Mycobacterium dioxanotrophicus]|uniref:Peptide transporter n=1 Tax=Mycobacterium dioxanotrophicus TaxID=482462 RepID=A0A1Y0CH09_9MYCO|nr:peptide transporter [Mycobacterium dioxanotrophicus]
MKAVKPLDSPNGDGAKVVVFLSQKGGVGKSTGTVNAAATKADLLRSRLSADDPSPVAAVSIDQQGSAVWWSERVNGRDFHVVQAHDDIDGLRKLRNLRGVKYVYVDTPGWIDMAGNGGADTLGDGKASDALRAVLDVADLAVIPMQPEPLCYKPTARTIKYVVEPRGLKYLVYINNWDPRDGERDRDETIEYVEKNGWPLANTVIRRYKLHTRASAEGQVVTDYPKNRAGMEARLDFSKLTHEIDLAVGA